MIDFETPGEATGELILPSTHQLIVNGTNIDDSLTDDTAWVETLSVSGRQTNEYNVKTNTPAGYTGDMVTGQQLNSKTITVTLQIESDDADITKDKMRRLNHLLNDTRSIQFSDEEEYTYYVRFSDASVDEEGAKQEVTLNFLWYDPLRYLAEQTIDYTNSEILEIDSSEPVYPYIEMKFTEGIKEWSIRNTTTDMNINYEHENVSSVYRLYLNEQTITKNVSEVNAMDGHNIESDLEEFTIDTGNQLVVTPEPESITIKYRGVSL